MAKVKIEYYFSQASAEGVGLPSRVEEVTEAQAADLIKRHQARLASPDATVMPLRKAAQMEVEGEPSREGWQDEDTPQGWQLEAKKRRAGK